MKKFLIFLSMGASLIASEKKTPHSRSLSIPGALTVSSETHSPIQPSAIDQNQAFQNLRLVEPYANAIKDNATKKLLEVLKRGNPLGSQEATQVLITEYLAVQTEITNNEKTREKNKKDETSEEKAQYTTLRIALHTNALILHYASLINEGIAYHASNPDSAKP